MYSIVLRHLSGIQKGIQSSHSIVEFQLKYGQSDAYERWAKTDKTIVVLEAGTTAQLEKVMRRLKRFKIPFAVFHEPDIGNVITSVSFLIGKCSDECKEFLSKFNLA
jgi:hypothetical protein